ncbi:Y-family DNA polymerase [Shewanella sp. GXUN23E]|uniref:Y-family DNA polymerase n=1 Tax=Shewanella sp. GXUN23E TaxID=3422498 RepID=UPI003D7CDF5A
MLWLAVYFPGYLLQYLKSRLDLTDDPRPYALHNDKGEILLCDARAAIVGVELGQSVATACSLCGELQLLPFNETSANAPETGSSAQAVEWLCQWSYDFSARVVPLVCSPWLEAAATGSQRSYAQRTHAQGTYAQGTYAQLTHTQLTHTQHTRAQPASTRLTGASAKSLIKASTQAISGPLGIDTVADTLLLEVGSMGNLFGGLDGLMAAYKQRAAEYGLECVLALGHTRLSAALQTRLECSSGDCSSGDCSSGDCSSLNRSAVDSSLLDSPAVNCSSGSGCQTGADGRDKPMLNEQMQDGQVRQSSPKQSLNDELARLAKLALSHYPLDADALSRLAGMGITTLGQLRALPTAELGKRFGTALLFSLKRLDASMPEPCDYYQLPQQYRRELNLLHEVEQFQGLLFPLGRLFAELETYLRQRQLAVLNLTLYLKYRNRDTPPLVLTLNYPFAEHRADGLMALCRLQLERQTLFQPVTDMVLEALHFVAPASMSAGQSRALGRDGKQGEIRRLQATLQARLGDACVLKLTVADAHLPERANRALPATQAAMSQSNPLSLHACRPCWLLPEPRELAADDVTLLKGPERIDAPWWEEQAVSRDYYLARHQNGGYCWVYRSAEGLFLQGWF